MEQVYIILTYPQSIPSKVIRLFTRKPYSHTSLAFDRSLDGFYSFGRKGLYNLLNAGFIQEHIGKGVLGRRDTSCLVIAVNVTAEEKKAMWAAVQDISDHKDEYGYNFMGFFANAINKYPPCNKKFVCSQFVAYVLEAGGVNVLGKPYEEARPNDFRISKCDRLEVVYEGGMNEYPYRVKEPIAG